MCIRARIVILSSLDASDTLPAISITFAVIEWVANSKSELGVKDQFPSLSDIVVPREEPSEKISTVLSASAVPVKVGVVSEVISSLSELPVSELEERSGVEGVDGPVVSIVRLSSSDSSDVLPAVSVTVAVIK